MNKQQEFYYVIARPWDKTKAVTDAGNMCRYTVHSNEIFIGTMKDANNTLAYVLMRSKYDSEEHDYQIIRMNPEVIITKGKNAKQKRT